MYSGKIVFSQVMDHLPMYHFHRCVKKYQGSYPVRTFSYLDQFLCMAFGQLTYRDSLRSLVISLTAQQPKLFHMGIRGKLSKSTLADANEKRDWRSYAEFAHILIQVAQNLYAQEDLGLEIKESVYALDASTIDLCLSIFPWARFRRAKAAIKLHTLLDLRGSIPSFIQITDGKIHDVNILDQLLLEPGAFYIMDRAYLDFLRLYRFTQQMAFFITRAKSNLKAKRIYSHPVDKTTGLICDQTIRLSNFYASQNYPDKLRRIKYRDPQTQKKLCFLTNNFNLPALTITQLYRCRWQVELFFKWIKQHLKIKQFYGTSQNSVKSQIWIAISVYLLVAIMKKRLKLKPSLYTILQILSVTCFEKTPILSLFSNNNYTFLNQHQNTQLNLFNF